MNSNPYQSKSSAKLPKRYNEFPVSQLKQLRTIEFFLFCISIVIIILTFNIFIYLHFNGIISLSPAVQIDLATWNNSLQLAYRNSWYIISLCIMMLVFRYLMQMKTALPSTKKTQLSKNQIFGDQKFISTPNTADTQEKEIGDNQTNDLTDEISIALRSPNAFYGLNLILILIIVLHLNYFPRGLALFPSYIQVSESVGILTAPAQFSGFFMINVIFQLSILMGGLFLGFYCVRQIKDLQKTLHFKHFNSFGENDVDSQVHPWKPPMPKPWKLMTLHERRDYQMESLKRQKAYLKQQDQEKLKQKIYEEKMKIKYGQKSYRKIKEETENTKESKKESKDKEKTKKNDRFEYDFR